MNKHYFALDTMRTILAFVVALGHFSIWAKEPQSFPAAFYLTVDLFFVLSGFVLTKTVMYDTKERFTKFLHHFFIRRFFRIYPLYLFLILINLFLTFYFGDNTPSFFYFSHAMLLQCIGFGFGPVDYFPWVILFPTWSISVELWVGIALFTLIYALRNHRVLMMIFVGLSSLISALVLMSHFSHLNLAYEKLGPLTAGSVRGLFNLSLGAGSFFLYQSNNKKYSPLLVSASEIAIILAVFFLYETPNKHSDFIAPILFSLLILALANGTGIISRLLGAPLLKPIRPISYSVYLFHSLLIIPVKFLKIEFGHAEIFIFVITLLVVSMGLYHFLEKPWIERGRRILARKKTQATLQHSPS